MPGGFSFCSQRNGVVCNVVVCVSFNQVIPTFSILYSCTQDPEDSARGQLLHKEKSLDPACDFSDDGYRLTEDNTQDRLFEVC